LLSSSPSPLPSSSPSPLLSSSPSQLPSSSPSPSSLSLPSLPHPRIQPIGLPGHPTGLSAPIQRTFSVQRQTRADLVRRRAIKDAPKLEQVRAPVVPVKEVEKMWQVPAMVEEKKEKKSECAICLDSTPTHLPLPCRHLCCCAACFIGLSAGLAAGVVVACPMCRATPSSWIEVFVS